MSEFSLSSLQHQFAQALHYKSYKLPSLQGVAKEDALLQVYRNNFIVTLSEHLACLYPVVFALVGASCFQALSRYHILNTPMKDPCIESYGAGFDNNISSVPNVIEEVPYLGEIATLEWNIYQISQTKLPTSLFPQEALSTIPASDLDRIQLIVSKSVCVMKSAFPIASIWTFVTKNEEDHLYSLNPMQAEALIIQREKNGVIIKIIDKNEMKLIDSCSKYSLGEIDPVQLSYITQAMQDGAFVNFSLKD